VKENSAQTHLNHQRFASTGYLKWMKH